MKQVQYIHCDNAGENVALVMTCKQEGLGITFEYTAPGTPQQMEDLNENLQTCMAKYRAKLENDKFTATVHKKHWVEAANTAPLFENNSKLSDYDSNNFE